MSMFPDCRHDDFYNEDFLNKNDAGFLRGFDYALEIICNLIQNNLNAYENELTEVLEEGAVAPSDEVFSTREDLYDILSENADLVSSIITHWHESERDEIITLMIDNMDDDEYNQIRNKVLDANEKLIESDKKEYFDTRKFACTGKKVFTRENK